MKVKTCLLMVSWSLLSVAISAQTLVFERTFNKSKYNELLCMSTTTDGGCIWGGNYVNKTQPGTRYSSEDGWIVKLSKSGKTQWEKLLNDSCGDYVQDIQQTSDKGYIALLMRSTNVVRNSGLLLLKMAENGNVEWERSFPSLVGDYDFKYIRQAKTGEYFVAGTKANRKDNVSTFADLNNPLICKFSAKGDLLWQKPFSPLKNSSLSGFSVTKEDGCVLAGKNELLLLDKSGNLLFRCDSIHSTTSAVESFQLCSDGGYLLVGRTWGLKETVGVNAWVAKLSSAFKLQWEHSYGGSGADFFSSVTSNPDGTFVLTGETNSTNGDVKSGFRGENDVWLVKIAADGALVWEKTFGSPLIDRVKTVQRTKDGRYVLGVELHNPPVSDLIDLRRPATPKKVPTTSKSDVSSPIVAGSINFWIASIRE